MGYSINTNITSLQAQEYLRTTSDFQTKTINRVTSGLRIISSGDDAAGLAIANSFRSDRSVLTQGVRNANDGLSTLQTIDGGINNISLLLDRARSLAAQSASGTFKGDRALLNSEFSSVVAEIDRQSQAIGLDVGGTYAKAMSVFIGGGTVHDGAAASGAITNVGGRDLIHHRRSARWAGRACRRWCNGHQYRHQRRRHQRGEHSASGPISTASEQLHRISIRGPGFGDANQIKVSVHQRCYQHQHWCGLNNAITQAGTDDSG
jgi:hypothetical protein